VGVPIRDSQVSWAFFESLTTNVQKLFIPDKKLPIKDQEKYFRDFENFL